MPHLYNTSDVSKTIERIQKLKTDSQRQWGSMSPAQMLAHTNLSLEMAMGKHVEAPVSFIGRMFGKLLKATALGEKPFAKNSPTAKSFIIGSELDLEEQRTKVIAALNKFHADGPSKCTTNPHPFFGHFSPEQWALFQWKHFDHHLRQFGI